jgi:hypothetical protein
VLEGGGEVARKLPLGDVVLVVCLVGAERGLSVGTMARPSGRGARAHRRGGPGCVGAGMELDCSVSFSGLRECCRSTGLWVWDGRGS